jgi:hypothetical protein
VAILLVLVLATGIGLGWWAAARLRYPEGRADERRQVIAFLMTKGSDCNHSPEDLAKAIDDGEHLRWDLTR